MVTGLFGSIEPLPHKSGNPPKIKEEHYPILQKLVEENNDNTLEELSNSELDTAHKLRQLPRPYQS